MLTLICWAILIWLIVVPWLVTRSLKPDEEEEEEEEETEEEQERYW